MKTKIALVTGSSKGIGKSIADQLEKHNYIVIRNNSSTDDLSCIEGINSIVDKLQKFTYIDVIVNNAAYTEFQTFDNVSDQLFDKMFALNLKAPLQLVQKLKNKLLPTSSIINIGSIAGVTGNGSNIGYSSLKAALISMTKSMARDLAPIRVNCISPGLIDTTFVKFPDGTREDIVSKTPINRIGVPEDIADAVIGLLNMKYVTGHNLLVDGGKILN